MMENWRPLCNWRLVNTVLPHGSQPKDADLSTHITKYSYAEAVLLSQNSQLLYLNCNWPLSPVQTTGASVPNMLIVKIHRPLGLVTF